MILNKEEVKKLPKADALCLHAYVKSQEAMKEYQEKIEFLNNPEHLSCQIFALVKETHENYSNILLNILAELPTIKDSMFIKESPLQRKAKKIRTKK